MKNVALFGLGLLALCLTSCKKDAVFDQEKYDNLVKESFVVDNVDPNHNWATVGTGTATVTVSDVVSGSYEVTVFKDYPVAGSQPVYLCQGTVENGSTLDMKFSYPIALKTLYVAAVDRNGHRQVKAVPVENGRLRCVFGQAAASSRQGARRAATSGQPYSVPSYSAPSVSAYNQGTSISDATNRTDQVDTYYKLDSDWTGVFQPIASGSTSISAPVNVYVTAKWTINGDQRVNGGCNIIVADGGEIVVQQGASLTTNDDHNYSGMVYVMPGGKISGKGLLKFSNATEGIITPYSYNGGSIDVGTIDLNGGTLYNAANGQLKASELVGGGTGSRLINQGNAHITNAGNDLYESFSSTYAGLQIWNACQLVVDNRLNIGGESHFDDGSYTECGALHCGGSNQGGAFLAMGHNAVINVVEESGNSYRTGDVKFDNFGIQGPASSTTGKAIVIFKQANHKCNYSMGIKDTYIYNYVELVVPSSLNIYGTCYDLFNGMLNGYLTWGGYYDSVVGESERNAVYSHDTPSYTIDVSECSKGVTSGGSGRLDPQPFRLRYCFEDNFPNVGDYDFNDVVLTLTPTVSGKTLTLQVSLDAVGATKTIGAAIRVIGLRRSDLAQDPVAQGFTALPNEPWTKVSPYTNIDTDETFLDAGVSPNRKSDGMVVVLFKDAHWAINPVKSSGGQVINKFYNTVQDRNNDRGLVVTPKTATYTFVFNDEEKAQSMLAQNLYDVFIVESHNGAPWEVHTVQNGFKTQQVLTADKGVSSSGKTYEEAYGTNMPWAIMVEGNTFRYPVEWQVIGRQKASNGNQLEGAYRTAGHSFAEWAANSATATDWYDYPDASVVY